MKITIYINYPYVGTNATDRVALFVYGRAGVEYHEKSSTQQTPLNGVNTGASAFTWITYANADGTNVTVGQSPVTFSNDGSDRVFGIYFSVNANRPAAIVWDPTFGSIPYSGAGTVVISIFLLLVSLLF